MLNRVCHWFPWAAAAAAVVAVCAGEFIQSEPLFWGGVATAVCLAILHGSGFWRTSTRPAADPSAAAETAANDRVEPSREADRLPATAAAATAQPTDLRTLIEQMLGDGRCALLLRPQIAENLSAEMLAAAQDALDRAMGLVPAGEVLLEPNRLGRPDDDPQADPVQGVVIEVAAAYLDRYPVTNGQFQAFVDAGGYEQMSIWAPEVWPAVLDLTDATGRPGPRFWRNGRFPSGRANHPVVGVCWYEAAAFARWIGKRLPTDAEWVKAAAWPVKLSTSARVQRKYPWGDAMERTRANLWGSGPGDTVAVEEFAGGVSVGGVYQLIGNVWEWTADDFEWTVRSSAETSSNPGDLLKAIRGGAFDTYFDNQATSQFASGECPLARKHNIGFRCALGICDLVALLGSGVADADSVGTDAGSVRHESLIPSS